MVHWRTPQGWLPWLSQPWNIRPTTDVRVPGRNGRRRSPSTAEGRWSPRKPCRREESETCGSRRPCGRTSTSDTRPRFPSTPSRQRLLSQAPARGTRTTRPSGATGWGPGAAAATGDWASSFQESFTPSSSLPRRTSLQRHHKTIMSNSIYTIELPIDDRQKNIQLFRCRLSSKEVRKWSPSWARQSFVEVEWINRERWSYQKSKSLRSKKRGWWTDLKF